MGRWRPDLLVPLAAFAAVYMAGWTRLVRRSPAGQRARLVIRAAAGLGALGVVAVALIGLDAAAHTRFAWHMTQHVLLISVAAPLLLVADPFAAAIWALPAAVRRRIRRTLVAGGPARRAWRAFTRLPVAWTLSTLSLWAWHAPSLYDAALAQPLLHHAEHLTFFTGALLFWWPLLTPAPRAGSPPSMAARVVYVVLGAFQTAALGVGLMFAGVPLYAYEGGIDAALDDQAWGGAVMWIIGGGADMAAVLMLVWRTLSPARSPVAGPARLTPSGSWGKINRLSP